MASNSVMLPGDVDVAKICLGETKPMGKNGGKIVNLKYNKNQLLNIQTPMMSSPFGINRWSSGDGAAPDKYSLDLSFKNYEDRPSVKQFLTLLQDMDKRLITEGVANSKEWLKKTRASVDVVEALYTPMVRWAKDKVTQEPTDKYPPTFKMSIPHRDGILDVEAYGEDGKTIVLPSDPEELTRITKGARIAAIAQCSGVWLAANKFGVTWKVKQLMVLPGNIVKGFAFVPVKDDGDVGGGSDLDEHPPPAAAKAQPKAATNKGVAAVTAALASTIVHTSDEEGGDDDDDYEGGATASA
jgi:hypothetical protein